MPKPLFLPAALAVAAVVLAVYAACTVERSTTYADGAPVRRAPVRVAPTHTPPGTGLPEYWGPPEAKPDVHPNPRPKRYLPPEPDGKPGIWASEVPKDPDGPLLLGLDLPYIPDATADDKIPTDECASAELTWTAAIVSSTVGKSLSATLAGDATGCGRAESVLATSQSSR